MMASLIFYSNDQAFASYLLIEYQDQRTEVFQLIELRINWVIQIKDFIGVQPIFT
jgi:hypothetical protein